MTDAQRAKLEAKAQRLAAKAAKLKTAFQRNPSPFRCNAWQDALKALHDVNVALGKSA